MDITLNNMSINPEFVIDPKLLVQVMLGGNALLTFESKKTKDHRVFHIRKDTYSKKDFTKAVRYKVFRNGMWIATFTDMQLSFISVSNPDNKILEWIWDHILDPAYIDRQLAIYHNGKCCVCGRQLTDPESIKLGIGPTCRDK